MSSRTPSVTAYDFIEDGFGNAWMMCRQICELELVRPGKVQCHDEAACGREVRRKVQVYKHRTWDKWVAFCPCCDWSTLGNVRWYTSFLRALVHVNRTHMAFPAEG